LSSDTNQTPDPQEQNSQRSPVLNTQRKITLTFLFGLLILILIQTAQNPYFRPVLSPEYWKTLGKIGQVLRIVHANYVEEEQADMDTLANEALEAMVSSLDQHSRYFPPKDYETYQKYNRMEYVGIGVQVQEILNRIFVIDVFSGGSAAEEGVLPGDQILKVDQEDISHLTLEQAVNLIKGPKNTSVQLKIYRELPQPASLEFSVERREIIRDSVNNVQILPPDIGYLEITKFTANTPELLSNALDGLWRKGASSLIIDLRGNPGGLLPVCVDVASEFLPDNKLVLSIRSRREDQKEELVANEDGRQFQLPVFILQDRYSASASEILAGCLKSYGLAKVIGEQSHGKGTVQTVYNLKNNAGMKMTTAKYYLPNGTTIAGKGVTPHFEIPSPVENAHVVRLSLLHRDQMTPSEFQQTFGIPPLPDPQLEAAIHLSQVGSLDNFDVEPFFDRISTSALSPTSGVLPNSSN
jgi:carboxyl-terminal processing protease